MKQFLFILFIGLGALLITGCLNSTGEYRKFVKTYGSETRTFCDGGFKMRETFISPKASKPVLSLINSQDCRNKQSIEEKIKARQ